MLFLVNELELIIQKRSPFSIFTTNLQYDEVWQEIESERWMGYSWKFLEIGICLPILDTNYFLRLWTKSGFFHLSSVCIHWANLQSFLCSYYSKNLKLSNKTKWQFRFRQWTTSGIYLGGIGHTEQTTTVTRNVGHEPPIKVHVTTLKYWTKQSDYNNQWVDWTWNAYSTVLPLPYQMWAGLKIFKCC